MQIESLNAHWELNVFMFCVIYSISMKRESSFLRKRKKSWRICRYNEQRRNHFVIFCINFDALNRMRSAHLGQLQSFPFAWFASIIRPNEEDWFCYRRASAGTQFRINTKCLGLTVPLMWNPHMSHTFYQNRKKNTHANGVCIVSGADAVAIAVIDRTSSSRKTFRLQWILQQLELVSFRLS